MTQATLFNPGIERTATFGGPDDCYRYILTRRWDEGSYVNFLMLNPSTADANVDDPTIRRCIGYARAWGYGSLVVTNLFAWRATDPKQLKSIMDPVGPKNDRVILETARAAHMVIAAWGNHGNLHGRDDAVRRLLAEAGIALHCLTVSPGSGQPAHPLYLPACLTPKLL